MIISNGPQRHGTKNKVINQIVESHLKESSLWNEVKDRLHAPASKLSIGQQAKVPVWRGAVRPKIC